MGDLGYDLLQNALQAPEDLGSRPRLFDPGKYLTPFIPGRTPRPLDAQEHQRPFSQEHSPQIRHPVSVSFQWDGGPEC